MIRTKPWIHLKYLRNGRRAWDRLMRIAAGGQMVKMDGVPNWRVKAGGR
jgi:hypothetical protein